MELALTEDQTMLANTASSFIQENSPISRMRALRDGGTQSFSPDVYKQMAELGWTGIPFSEADGGMDMGMAEMILVTEAMGRGLAPEPVLTSIMMGGQALALAGSDAQRAQWLPAVIEADKVIALAHLEQGGRHSLTHVATKAQSTGGGYRLSGEKLHVLEGDSADAFVIVARTSGGTKDAEGISLFLVPGDASGLSRTAQKRVDSRGCAVINLDGVEVGKDALVGAEGAGLAVLEQVIERATVALCGEMLGGMSEAFERTIEYLKERKQFDVPIGSFQALKHRAANMFIEVELSRSATMAAARAIDEGGDDASSLVAVAKARCSDAYVLIANEAVQMHGGIGMTDEHDIGLFMKRARAAEITFGDAGHQRDRYATLNSY